MAGWLPAHVEPAHQVGDGASEEDAGAPLVAAGENSASATRTCRDQLVLFRLVSLRGRCHTGQSFIQSAAVASAEGMRS